MKRSVKAKRETFYNIFRDFGSLLAFTIRFTLLGISQMQGFSLANSLIKKLYSVEEENDDEQHHDLKPMNEERR